MLHFNKYHSKKIKTDEGIFDSKYEYEEWTRLKFLEKAGEIYNLERQVKIELLPHFRTNQEMIRSITYIADFIYIDKGIRCIVDTKGFPTKDYILKKKLLLFKLEDNECFIERKKGKLDKIYKKSQK